MAVIGWSRSTGFQPGGKRSGDVGQLTAGPTDRFLALWERWGILAGQGKRGTGFQPVGRPGILPVIAHGRDARWPPSQDGCATLLHCQRPPFGEAAFSARLEGDPFSTAAFFLQLEAVSFERNQH